MTVAYTNRRAVAPEVEAELDAERLDLDELLATSDVVSINCPYSSETHHLIGAEQFELMRDSAFLVNTARGPIVDEAALVQRLCAAARSPVPASMCTSTSRISQPDSPISTTPC